MRTNKEKLKILNDNLESEVYSLNSHQELLDNENSQKIGADEEKLELYIELIDNCNKNIKQIETNIKRIENDAECQY